MGGNQRLSFSGLWAAFFVPLFYITQPCGLCQVLSVLSIICLVGSAGLPPRFHKARCYPIPGQEEQGKERQCAHIHVNMGLRLPWRAYVLLLLWFLLGIHGCKRWHSIFMIAKQSNLARIVWAYLYMPLA
jgi:hypothetical protein